jgi:hypothetical protein
MGSAAALKVGQANTLDDSMCICLLDDIRAAGSVRGIGPTILIRFHKQIKVLTKLPYRICLESWASWGQGPGANTTPGEKLKDSSGASARLGKV